MCMCGVAQGLLRRLNSVEQQQRLVHTQTPQRLMQYPSSSISSADSFASPQRTLHAPAPSPLPAPAPAPASAPSPHVQPQSQSQSQRIGTNNTIASDDITVASEFDVLRARTHQLTAEVHHRGTCAVLWLCSAVLLCCTDVRCVCGLLFAVCRQTHSIFVVRECEAVGSAQQSRDTTER